MISFTDFQKRVHFFATKKFRTEEIKNFLYARINDKLFWNLIKNYEQDIN